MIKGRTTIQLRNAKTGKIEREIKHDNIVTNAVQNVFSLPYAVRSLYATSASDVTGSANGWEAMIRGQNMPYYAKAYGGISLFRDALTLDASNVMIDGKNKLVGYAGDVGTEVEADMLCGERNATESKELENGYHFVWDFDTEKANGTFRSVSLGLTDRAKYDKITADNCVGFNATFKCGPSASGGGNPALNWFCNWFGIGLDEKVVNGTSLINRVVYLDLLENKEVAVYSVCITSDSENYPNIQITREILTPFYKMSIFSKTILAQKEETILAAERLPSSCAEWIYTSQLYKHVQNIQIDDDNNIHILYFADLAHRGSSLNTASKFVHTIYALDGTRISSKVVSFPTQKQFTTTDACVPCGYYEGLYYDIAPNSEGVFVLRRFNESGIVKDEAPLAVTYTTPQHSGIKLCNFSVSSAGIAHVAYSDTRGGTPYNDLYMLPSGDGEKPFLLRRAQNGVWQSHMKYNYPGIKQPFEIMSSLSQGNSATVGIVASPLYLGTINNLDTAITKTNAQTMKIIYDLVEE